MLNPANYHEELVLRRVFVLCHLNTLSDASYRIALNPERSSEVPSAQDYTRIDYNYVSIRKKTHALIVQAIIEQPGPRLEYAYVDALLERWSKPSTEPQESLHSYTLDTAARRLVKDTHSVVMLPWLYVLIENCPRTGYPRVSFSLHFLKQRLPDLMGETAVESLEAPPDSLCTCIGCLERPRDCILTPCNHVILCMACADTLKPTECLVCRNAIAKIERIYLS